MRNVSPGNEQIAIDFLLLQEAYSGLSNEYTALKNSLEQKNQLNYTINGIAEVISNAHINFTNESHQKAIQYTLETIGKNTHASRCTLFIFKDEDLVDYIHEWCQTEDDSQIDKFKGVKLSQFQKVKSAFLSRTSFIVNHPEELPEDALGERSWMTDKGFRSVIFTPLILDNILVGALAIYGPYLEPVIWDIRAENYLKLVGKLVLSLLMRLRMEVNLIESEYFFKESQKAGHIGSYKADFIKDDWETSEVMDEIFGIDKSYKRNIQSWLNIVYSEDRDMMNTYFFDDVAKQRKPFNKEYRIQRINDGVIRWVHGLGMAEFNNEGNIISLIGTIQDITNRKIEEMSRLKIEENLRINLLALESKNTQLNDFCSIVSHNIRGPLVNISMLVDYIESSSDENEKSRMLKKMKPVLATLNDTFTELIESLQVRQDVGIPNDHIELKTEIAKVIRLYETEITSYNVVININVSAAPVLHYPSKYITSILLNLISNAIKYRYPDRRLEISIKTEYQGDKIIMSVSDNGLGINLKLHQEHLFKVRKVFHKHPNANGFGLYMTKTQIDAMGGKIWVKSEPEVGSTFFIEFINQKHCND